MKKRLLIIDALNAYFRAYIVDPSLSLNGQPIGGLKGFLKIIQKLVRETKPDEVIICWDGEGGSKKRKATDKNYKAGRKPIRLNRDIRNLTENEEIENKVWQMTRLVEYLNHLSVIQLMVPSVEADDIISYVTKQSKYKGWEQVIVSSDKDFFQLCDDDVIVYRPIQKKIMNKNRIIEEFNIHPTNMALARAIVGDKSDNLEGIRGVGLPTVKSRLPFLVEDKSYTIDEVVDYCKEVDSNLKVYERIAENRDVIEHNYKMMQLYSPLISPQGKQKIRFAVENYEPEINKTKIRSMMVEDGFGVVDFSDLFAACQRIVVESKKGN